MKVFWLLFLGFTLGALATLEVVHSVAPGACSHTFLGLKLCRRP